MEKRNTKIGRKISSYLKFQKSEPDVREEEDVQRFVGICKSICKINMTNDNIERAIRLGKVTEDKDRLLLITMKDENKKCEVFQNLSKL